MCGRFAQFNPNIGDKFQAKPKKSAGELLFNFNYSPGTLIKAIIKDGGRYIVNLRWGITAGPAAGKKLNIINIRNDTLIQKKIFGDLFRNKRCLIIADGFFEWKKNGHKIPYYITMKDRETFAFAGLWSETQIPGNDDILSCAIITSEANDLVCGVHNRMPVILQEKDYDAWLDNSRFDKDALSSLLVPFSSDLLEMYEVSGKVNYADNNMPDLILPVAADNLF